MPAVVAAPLLASSPRYVSACHGIGSEPPTGLRDRDSCLAVFAAETVGSIELRDLRAHTHLDGVERLSGTRWRDPSPIRSSDRRR